MQDFNQLLVNRIKPDSNIFCVARRGQGKTTLSKAIQELKHRKVIVDINGEYNDERYIYAVGLKDFKAKLTALQDLDQYSLVFRFSPYENDVEVFDEICKWVFHVGDLTFVVEEVHNFCTFNSLPHWLLKITAQGRHENIGYIFTSVSPGIINKQLFGQCDFYFLGHIINKRDRDYFSDQLGDQVNELKHLKPRQFYFYDVLQNESILIQT